MLMVVDDESWKKGCVAHKGDVCLSSSSSSCSGWKTWRIRPRSVARREGWWTSVASMEHVLSRAAVDVRDLCAVTTFHIYGNYYHATRIRCFSMLRYMHIMDPSRFNGVF